MTPIQIRSQTLRRLGSHPTTFGSIAPMADDCPPGPDDRPAGRARWRQSDVKRAIAAAEQAGLESYRVELAPDGTIAIIVGEPADTAAGPAGC